jgi:hypothetical protein
MKPILSENLLKKNLLIISLIRRNEGFIEKASEISLFQRNPLKPFPKDAYRTICYFF